MRSNRSRESELPLTVTAHELKAVLGDIDAGTAEHLEIRTPHRSSRPSSAKDALTGLGGLLRPGSR
jgi:hypothetical protein